MICEACLGMPLVGMDSWTKIYYDFICTTAPFSRSIPEMGVMVLFVVRCQIVDMSVDERASRMGTRALRSGRVGTKEAMQTGESSFEMLARGW